jgi:hypothetical protein
MMFALLQDQHKLQLEAMATANKVVMEAMMEQMNAMSGGNGGKRSKRDKENMPPSTNANKGNDIKAQKANRKKRLCPHCNMLVYHKPDKCYKLEANKDRRFIGWKSEKETST